MTKPFRPLPTPESVSLGRFLLPALSTRVFLTRSQPCVICSSRSDQSRNREKRWVRAIWDGSACTGIPGGVNFTCGFVVAQKLARVRSCTWSRTDPGSTRAHSYAFIDLHLDTERRRRLSNTVKKQRQNFDEHLRNRHEDTRS